MSNFIKNALSELEHVVWPTEAESKKYMIYTVWVIIVMASLLSLIWYMLRGSLVTVRDQFSEYHTTPVVSTVSGEELATEADLENLKQAIVKKRASQSGTTNSGQLGTGMTIDLSGTGGN